MKIQNKTNKQNTVFGYSDRRQLHGVREALFFNSVFSLGFVFLCSIVFLFFNFMNSVWPFIREEIIGYVIITNSLQNIRVLAKFYFLFISQSGTDWTFLIGDPGIWSSIV